MPASLTPQLSLRLRRPKPIPKHGGKRAGAGRPAKGPRPSQRHTTRPRCARPSAFHVTVRTVDAVRGLRQLDAYRAMRRALATTFARRTFRVVHLSIQSNHIHLIVEADDHEALARGMQGLQISAAQHLNRVISRRRGQRRRGQVFVDRYHASRLTGPTHARNALAYCLLNWRRHEVDRRSAPVRLDPYSSALFFDGWKDAERPRFFDRRLEPLPVALPHTWLLTTGWRRAGLLSPREQPRGRPA